MPIPVLECCFLLFWFVLQKLRLLDENMSNKLDLSNFFVCLNQINGYLLEDMFLVLCIFHIFSLVLGIEIDLSFLIWGMF